MPMCFKPESGVEKVTQHARVSVASGQKGGVVLTANPTLKVAFTGGAFAHPRFNGGSALETTTRADGGGFRLNYTSAKLSDRTAH